MGEGYIATFVKGITLRLAMYFTLVGLLLIGVFWATQQFISSDPLIIATLMAITTILLALIVSSVVSKLITQPTVAIAQAVLHLSPNEHLVSAPNLDSITVGKDLAENIIRHIYSYATSADQSANNSNLLPANIFDQLPVALIGLDENGVITLANSKAIETAKVDQLSGLKMSEVLTFTSDQEDNNIQNWLKNAQDNSLKEVSTWQKIQLNSINDGALGYFDVAISFNKHSASGIETIITLYDHSDAYSDESSSISFVAMAVHELRTPLTILRGYIEAFDEELGPTATPELISFLHKMNASAESMATFVSNILNVAKINQNELSLSLKEGSWNQLLPEIIDNLRDRASANNKQIELRMEPNLPSVAVDRTTINEVITNLIENAIKYTPENAPNITVISRLNTEGSIETTVQDQGVGIPSSVMPHLFTKFSRNHRNKTKIGGTGLGLFLSKAIVSAHHGHIWANSKEGQGSLFGFTLLPYDQLAKELQTDDNGNITRTQHGWIKNHSMQRR